MKRFLASSVLALAVPVAVTVASPMAVADVASAPGEASAVSTISDSSSDSAIEDAFSLYLVQEDEGPPMFDADRTAKDGASDFLIDVGNSYNEWQFARSGDRVSFPYHGNWCGPGHSGPDAPIDTLDTACMHHDKCYAERGYNSCSCDDELVAEINRNYGQMNGGEKVKAQGIKLAMKVKPCN